MSLFSIFRSGDPALIFAAVFSRLFIVFVCLPIHELAHGWVAYKMGDSTAKNLGRLTFNPFPHLDLFGTIMLFLFGIGYANPVPVNPFACVYFCMPLLYLCTASAKQHSCRLYFVVLQLRRFSECNTCSV